MRTTMQIKHKPIPISSGNQSYGQGENTLTDHRSQPRIDNRRMQDKQGKPTGFKTNGQDSITDRMTTTDLQSIPQTAQAIDDDAIATDTVTFRDSKHSLEEMITLRYKHNMSINQIADKMGCHKSTEKRKPLLVMFSTPTTITDITDKIIQQYKHRLLL